MPQPAREAVLVGRGSSRQTTGSRPDVPVPIGPGRPRRPRWSPARQRRRPVEHRSPRPVADELHRVLRLDRARDAVRAGREAEDRAGPVGVDGLVCTSAPGASATPRHVPSAVACRGRGGERSARSRFGRPRARQTTTSPAATASATRARYKSAGAARRAHRRLPSLDQLATVDDEHLTGDVGERGGEGHERARHVVRGSQPAHRGGRGQPLPATLVVRPDPLGASGADGAGRHHVHPDALVAERSRERVHHPDHPRLRRGVGGHADTGERVPRRRERDRPVDPARPATRAGPPATRRTAT